MYKTINSYEFADSFDRMGRGEDFTITARKALFEYYEELEEESGEKFELDVMSLCRAWSEYPSLEQAHEDLGLEEGEKLEDLTEIIELENGGVLVRAY